MTELTIKLKDDSKLGLLLALTGERPNGAREQPQRWVSPPMMTLSA
jgi:hypothetical protein